MPWVHQTYAVDSPRFARHTPHALHVPSDFEHAKKLPCNSQAYITQFVHGECAVQMPMALSMRGVYAARMRMIAAHTRMNAAHTRMISTPAQDINTPLLTNVKLMPCAPYQFAHTNQIKENQCHSYAIFQQLRIHVEWIYMFHYVKEM